MPERLVHHSVSICIVNPPFYGEKMRLYSCLDMINTLGDGFDDILLHNVLLPDDLLPNYDFKIVCGDVL